MYFSFIKNLIYIKIILQSSKAKRLEKEVIVLITGHRVSFKLIPNKMP